MLLQTILSNFTKPIRILIMLGIIDLDDSFSAVARLTWIVATNDSSLSNFFLEHGDKQLCSYDSIGGSRNSISNETVFILPSVLSHNDA